jgi:hypothetical protein
VQHGEVLLETERGGPYGANLQQSGIDPPFQVDADRAQVANQLVGYILFNIW